MDNTNIAAGIAQVGRRTKWGSIAWAFAAIAWAIAIYLIERERQWALVELARLTQKSEE
ncbi:MAG TPA: hypothetical protein VGD98_01100 [Ktedonobacteraceae bacterium]